MIPIRHRTVVGLALAAALCILAFPAAQGPLFQMNFAASAALQAGWQQLRTATPQWSLTHLPTGGPNGTPAYRLAILPISSGQTGQFNVGWRGQQLPTATPGSHLWFDILFRFTEDTDFRGKDWEDNQPGSNIINKWLMINRDGCTGGGCRVIVTIESDRSTLTWMIRVQKDGGDERVDTPFYPRGGPFKRVIIQIRYNTAPNSRNGGYSVWVDRDPSQTPTSNFNNANVNIADDSEELRFGGFQNHGVENGSVYAWEVARFVVTRTPPGGGATPPAPLFPSSVRIVQ